MASHSSPESYISGELDNVIIKEMLQIYKNEWTFNLNSFQIDIKETYLKICLNEGQLGRRPAKCATSVHKLSAN